MCSVMHNVSGTILPFDAIHDNSPRNYVAKSKHTSVKNIRNFKDNRNKNHETRVHLQLYY